MPNARFLDYSIAETEEVLSRALEADRAVVLRVTHDAVGRHREELRDFFGGLVSLSDSHLRQVEAVVSELARREADENAQPVGELLAEDNRRIRDRFVAELSPLRQEDVLRLASAIDPDAESVLKHWVDDGQILSVTHHGRAFYPVFAFKNGRPNPVIKAILSILGARLSAWQQAFWFVSANGWLSGKAPADLLDQPDAVISAARRELEPLIG